MRNGFYIDGADLAMAIIVIMTAIVYSSLSSVVKFTAMARAAPRNAVAQFLAHSLRPIFAASTPSHQ